MDFRDSMGCRHSSEERISASRLAVPIDPGRELCPICQAEISRRIDAADPLSKFERRDVDWGAENVESGRFR